MTKIDNLDEIKKIELDVLKEVDKLCREQNLRYYLGYGTLLGAIRHKGFIPWDDDIDILMPRPDYDKLISFCKNNDTTFGLVAHETNKEYNLLFAKAFAKNTKVCEHDNYNKFITDDYGVWVDIFPLDGLSNSFDTAKKLLKKEKFLINLYAVSLLKKFKRNASRPWYQEPVRLFCFLLTRFMTHKKLIRRIESICRQYGFDGSAYCGVVCENINNKEIISGDVYGDGIDVTFEGNLFKAPVDYDAYLKAIYGDYMTPPPVEERIPIHSFNVFYI